MGENYRANMVSKSNRIKLKLWHIDLLGLNHDTLSWCDDNFYKFIYIHTSYKQVKEDKYIGNWNIMITPSLTLTFQRQTYKLSWCGDYLCHYPFKQDLESCHYNPDRRTYSAIVEIKSSYWSRLDKNVYVKELCKWLEKSNEKIKILMKLQQTTSTFCKQTQQKILCKVK